MNSLRGIEVKYLKGFGARRASVLEKEFGIKSLYDLLHHFPTHYIDRSQYTPISSFIGEMPMVQVKGRFITFTIQGEGARRRLIGLFSDGHATMDVVWFRKIDELKNIYKPGIQYILFAKPTIFNNRWQMTHPEIEQPTSITATGGLRGVYPLTEKLRNAGFTSKTFFTAMKNVLEAHPSFTETLPAEIISRLRLMDLHTAISVIHNPSDTSELQKAKFRLKFEELFYIQLNLRRYANQRKSELKGHVFSKIGYYFNSFYNDCLKFELTGAQKKVVREIRADVLTGRQMNRLVQGDVGSGKTLVALLSMLIALDNGTQACLMAPTEILATQHYESISAMVAPIGVNVRLLTGSTHKKERDLIDEELRDGSLHILIGTHALLEDRVSFRNLGLAVIDEQHRFGVVQRSRLWTKNILPPHVLVMTATPIPRTLAMTVYGDLDVSVIDELPPGRKPIQTLLCYEEQRQQIYRSIGRQLKMGRQIYIVYPLIEDNEKVDLLSLQSGYEEICEVFPSYEVAMVHGKMKPAQKDYQMQRFVSGEADILVATTVIEVGVNVPNATTMLIEHAERFGLSQLHQLRGRVGRGGEQSYCVLMTKQKIARETRERLQILASTTDGFQIADADLRLRGPGDLEGTMQSGMSFDLKIANIARDGEIIQIAHNIAEDILDRDPALNSYPVLIENLNILFDKKIDLSRVS